MNNCEPAMPARMMCPVRWLPRALRASRVTRPNALSAPINAPPDMLRAPAPRPTIATSTAPVEAPAEIPSRYGSASGLRNSACNTTPDIASPAPQAPATRARGMR